MNIEEVREKALSLPFVTERLPYGPDCLAFEIGGKQFCLLLLSSKGNFYNLKVDPAYSLQLQDRYSGIRPGFHMNKKHWISVDFCGDVPDALQYELIEHAYHRTIQGLPLRVRKGLTL